MSQGKIRAMAVGVRSAMTVDWIALTAGIIGTGAAIIALMIMLERNAETATTAHECEAHSEQAGDAALAPEAPCPE